MPEFRCQFPTDEVQTWAKAYGNPDEDNDVIEAGRRARERGYLTRDDLLQIGEWKSPRVRAQRERNDDQFIHETTRIALSTPSEQLRIEILTLLRGVSWPTASCILHLAHNDPYPILDFRALQSLGVPQPNEYDFEFWIEYVRCCRQLAERAGCDMRTLDRALWGFSKPRTNPS